MEKEKVIVKIYKELMEILKGEISPGEEIDVCIKNSEHEKATKLFLKE